MRTLALLILFLFTTTTVMAGTYQVTLTADQEAKLLRARKIGLVEGNASEILEALLAESIIGIEKETYVVYRNRLQETTLKQMIDEE